MIKNLIAFLGVMVCVLFYTPVFAEGFYIENYDVDLQVNKNKQVHITEHIGVYFTEKSHGIYRDIPCNGARITNVQVSERNSVSKQNNKIHIKIGNPDILIDGKHSYTISYNFNYIDNKNEFYHNIVGTDWRAEIRHVNFKITMPEEFNPSDVGLSIGKYGTRGFEGGAEFSVNGLNITGQVIRTLRPMEGVTVRIALPEGYFVNEPVEEYPVRTDIILIILLCLVTAVSFMVWYKFGKDEKAIPVVNFYPPEGMNTLEVEIAYKEKASLRGLIAMLVSLAQRGYIRIHEEGKSFSLEKLKPYDGTDKLEKKYMNALFSVKRRILSIETNEIVTEEDLEKSRSFYNECTNVIHKANNNRDYLYEKMSINWGLRILLGICLLTALFITAYIFSKDISPTSSSTESVSMILILLLYFMIYFYRNVDSVLLSCLLSLPCVLFLLFSVKNTYNIHNLPATVIGIASIVICFICLYHLRKRNKQALRLLGDLMGFKKFIETAEKRQLEKLVYDNPQYFYNILPYAYLFGVSRAWIKKFERIITVNPSWYQGKHFDADSFIRFSDSMKKVSVPSEANGGKMTSSRGGGGFSGGGFGGGGGGRW